jgi:FkbM family methyltransferase
MIKRLISYLPVSWQHGLRRSRFRRQVLRGEFKTSEPEYEILDTLLKEADWAIDIGANVGHYTARFSDLVGTAGRVFAFEPIPETFEVLAANSLLFKYRNITLMNLAVSDRSGVVGFDIPRWDSGLLNYYEARIRSDEPSIFTFCCDLDSFRFGHPIRLVKIDAEGNELPVLMGMKTLLEADHPALIVEANSPDPVAEYLGPFGYRPERLPGSPNLIFKARP